MTMINCYDELDHDFDYDVEDDVGDSLGVDAGVGRIAITASSVFGDDIWHSGDDGVSSLNDFHVDQPQS